MALRLLEIVLPEEYANDVLVIIEEANVTNYWQACSCESRGVFKLILPAEKTEKVMDELEKKHAQCTEFHMALLPVEATFPSPKEIEQKNDDNGIPDKEEKIPLRVSRQELYSEIFDNSKLTSTFLIMVVLSTIVASIGLLKDNIALIIGAKVIAPLLGPNVALSFATTPGGSELGLKALKTNVVGIIVALAISFLLGFFLAVDPNIREIQTRTVVSYADIVLAPASGVAGVLSFTGGLPSAMIGVMVAVALIPPLVVFGLLLGGGFVAESVGALLLRIINMICVNIAGVVTFLLKGLQPINRWEGAQAQKASRYAIIIWTSLLLLLIYLLFISST